MFCPKCGKQNPDDSRFCQYCAVSLSNQGAVQLAYARRAAPPKPFYKKSWFVALCIVGGFIIFIGMIASLSPSEGGSAPDSLEAPAALAGAGASASDVTEAPTPEPTTSPEPAPTGTPITAKELIEAYEANEIKADNEYKGQMLAVTGIVDTIGTDIINDVYITIGLGGEYEVNRIQCYFKDKDEIDKVAGLLSGDEVTVVGQCSGKALLNVMLKRCSIGD